MNKLSVDVAVIGAGTAGLAAYRAARKHHDRVLIIESGPYGTTCARVGCMPSKLLIAAAEAAHHAREADMFGVHAGQVRVDGRAVMARVRSERDRFVGFVLESTHALPEQDRLRGYARFLNDHTLRIDDHTEVQARAIVIATGSSPRVPALFDGLGDRLIINDDVFDWQDLPESVVVFGPGVIGLEISQALHRLGVRVRLLGRGGAVGPLSDPLVRDAAYRAFSAEFPLEPDAHVESIVRHGDGVIVRRRDAKGTLVQERFDYLLAATGRSPHVTGLGLANTSLELDRFGVPVFDQQTLQCGHSNIFIAGDANNDVPLLHEAADEGAIAGDNAGRHPFIQRGHRRSPIGVVFSDPQLAMIGQRYDQLRPGRFVTGEVSFQNQGRSRVMGQNRGLLHLYADAATGRLLGAEMVGPRAEHLAHLLAWAHQQRQTIAGMLEMPFYHPVIEEGLRTALRDAEAKREEVMQTRTAASG
ncbi:MAG: dihydrolipoyl dehydrogenase [Aquisalimonadaceae bacterium]